MLDCTPFVHMRMRAIEVLRGGNCVREQNKGKWRDYMGLKQKIVQVNANCKRTPQNSRQKSPPKKHATNRLFLHLNHQC